MSNPHRLTLTTLLTLTTYTVGAHAQDATHAYQTWLGVFAQGPIAGPVFVQSDVHVRMYSDFSPQALLLRPGVAWQPMARMFITLGYAYTPSWRSAGQSFDDRINEHRLWEQWQYEVPIANTSVTVQFRTRLEQRWRPVWGSDTGWRARQFVRVTVPLQGPWVFTAWDELFVALNDSDWGQRGGFDQNRVFVGAGLWAVARTLRLELGYFNQYVYRRGAADAVNHAAMMNAFVVWR